MGLYTNTVTTTWANLRTTLAALTANTSVTISDPNNVIFAPMTSSPSTGTCFGDIIYSATPSTVLVDFSDNDFSANTNVTDASPPTGTYPVAGWFGIICSDTISYFCTRLSGMGKLPTITTSGYQMFHGCTALTSIDTSAFTNVTSASYMFQGCTSLASIDTTAFTNVTNAREMFQGCTSLASIHASVFTNLTSPTYKLHGCTALTSIDTAAFTNVTDASFMFFKCTSLASIDTTAFTNVTDASFMFWNCTSLTKIYMLNNIFSLASEPTGNNYFMDSVPTSCVFCVMPSSYSTWYTRLYTNYANWGLTAAKTPTTANLVVYHRVA